MPDHSDLLTWRVPIRLSPYDLQFCGTIITKSVLNKVVLNFFSENTNPNAPSPKWECPMIYYTKSCVHVRCLCRDLAFSEWKYVLVLQWGTHSCPCQLFAGFHTNFFKNHPPFHLRRLDSSNQQQLSRFFPRTHKWYDTFLNALQILLQYLCLPGRCPLPGSILIHSHILLTVLTSVVAMSIQFLSCRLLPRILLFLHYRSARIMSDHTISFLN